MVTGLASSFFTVLAGSRFCCYLRGARAEYLKGGSVGRENGSVFFDVLSSRTDVVTVQIGVTFRF